MRYMLPLALAALAGCGGPKPTTVEDFATTPLTLPGGQVLKVETMISRVDLLRGMMFRTSLPQDHGMLFVQPSPGKYWYWMYQTLIPLDIIWLDSNRNIVEIVQNAQPCKTQASQCEHYGGNQVSSWVLEVNGGIAKKYKLEVGQRIDW